MAMESSGGKDKQEDRAKASVGSQSAHVRGSAVEDHDGGVDAYKLKAEKKAVD